MGVAKATTAIISMRSFRSAILKTKAKTPQHHTFTGHSAHASGSKPPAAVAEIQSPMAMVLMYNNTRWLMVRRGYAGFHPVGLARPCSSFRPHGDHAEFSDQRMPAVCFLDVGVFSVLVVLEAGAW